MLIVFYGPGCSGKSSVAEIVAQRTGAEVWTGKDYLRLAKNEASARAEFIRRMKAAAEHPSLNTESMIYVLTGTPASIPELAEMNHVRTIGFTADIETLKSRFAPRTGGRVPPPVAAMLERAKAASDAVDADSRFDTTDSEAVDIADAIIADL